MSRPLRFIPENGPLVHVTCRTIQSRFLLRPSPALNQIVVGVLGRAQRLYQVPCHDIEREAAAELRKRGLQPLGVAAILKQRPHTRPAKTQKSPQLADDPFLRIEQGQLGSADVDRFAVPRRRVRVPSLASR